MTKNFPDSLKYSIFAIRPKPLKMKRIFFFFLFLFVLTSAIVQAQGLRLNGYVNYVFDDKFDNYYSNTSYMQGTIKGGLQWGVGLEYQPSYDYGIELLYFRQDTEAPIRYYRGGDRDRTVDLGINYIMLGGVRYAELNERIEGYGGLMAGMVIYDNKAPVSGEPNSVTKFAWGFRLGANIWATERVGLKVQTHLLSAVQAFGGSFYFGTGGSGAGVNTYSTLYQFSLGGGLVVKLGE